MEALNDGNMENKDTKTFSKSDKDTKRKENSFRRDPLTQTKLKHFFAKPSQEQNDSTPADSEDEGGLVIDENARPNYSDSTLKLEELDNSSVNDDNNKTKIIEEVSTDDENKNKRTKTFIINITLEGVSSKDKTKSKRVSESKENVEHVVDKVKENKQIKSTAKRKIKALFGESSESEFEQEEIKKPKITKSPRDSHKSKEKKPEKSKHRSSKKSKKERHSSDRDSKRRENKHKSEAKELEKTMIISNSSNELIDSFEDKNTSDNIDCDLENSELPIDPPPSEQSLDKAYQLSMEADKVLKELQKFTEIKAEPEIPHVPIDEVKITTTVVASAESISQTKHGTVGILKNKTDSTVKHCTDSSAKHGTDGHTKHRRDSNVKYETNKSAKHGTDDTAKLEADNTAKNKKDITEKQESNTEKHVIDNAIKHETDSGTKNELNNITKHVQDDAKHNIDITEKDTIQHRKEKRHSQEVDKHTSKESQHKLVKKVTFDKHSHKSSKTKERSSKHGKSEKVDVAGLVVKLLMPYYKKKKISNRDLFKITARHIVHQLLAIQVTEEAAITLLLKNAFKKEVIIEKESDLETKLNISKKA